MNIPGNRRIDLPVDTNTQLATYQHGGTKLEIDADPGQQVVELHIQDGVTSPYPHAPGVTQAIAIDRNKFRGEIRITIQIPEKERA